MRAAWFEHKGAACDVLVVGNMPTPKPGPGEVRVRIAVSGINPGDTKKRQDWLGTPMSYPRIIPHSDGAGVVDAVGNGVAADRLGQRVWVWGAQSYRPFGTAAEFVVVSQDKAIALPQSVSFEIGASLGISARTAHRCVFADGPVNGLTVLVTGGAGNVGNAAVALASWAGARVLATVSSPAQAELGRSAGASQVIDRHGDDLADRILAANSERPIDRIIDVAFAPNISVSERVITNGGVIVSYASDDDPMPRIPFWDLLFKNTVIRLVGSDDLPDEAERMAVSDIGACLLVGALRPVVARRFPLDQIADAHELIEHGEVTGHVLLDVSSFGDSRQVSGCSRR